MKLYAAELNFREIAQELGIPETFPPALHEGAKHVSDRRVSRRDMRHVPFVTIDPPGSMDLDQAVFIEKVDAGWRVFYAIADVGGLLDPHSEVALEALRRGQTIYLPDEPTRLHPAEFSEGAASLLPDQDRVALVWDVIVGDDGEAQSADIYPAHIRSVARLEYMEVQRSIDAGEPHPSIALLPDVGRARQGSALRRNAINLRLPSQSVVPTDDGRWELRLDDRPPVMDWNSEMSLLAGMMAGEMMAEAGIGVMRSLMPASKRDTREFTVAAHALGFDLGTGGSGSASGAGAEVSIGEIAQFLAGVDASTSRGMAVMKDAARLLRGSGYVRVGTTDEMPVHAGVGGSYAHVTAPLRRLIDRFGLEYCLAIAAQRRGETASIEVPAWVDEQIDQAIDSMKSSSALASNADRACLNKTEAVVLEPWVGHTFDAAVLHNKGEKSEVFVENPPVFANCVGAPEEGTQQLVSLIRAVPAELDVEFAWPAD
ncbi:RNB domain-containing ribonuclease [Corynebacterium sp. H113]|uniref:RNB domain-containing ribonuclease n=1 Tax=Corynebacterium sp. H113 TaxID=3133419 RepID=UPI00309E97F8